MVNIFHNTKKSQGFAKRKTKYYAGLIYIQRLITKVMNIF